MIILIRVYKDERVIAAEAYDHDERRPDHRHPLERCRCIPAPLWRQRMFELAHEFDHDKITETVIYPTSKGQIGSP